ncbi:MAG TPA: hypothetical protein VGN23_00335 [Verrucomicrobiae bacterium]|jgi:hypothetical protein
MPINLNLLAEAQAAEELRRRDPVKRAVFIGVSLVAVFVVWYAAVMALALTAKETDSSAETAIDAKTNAYNQVLVEQKNLDSAKAKLTALKKLQANRFLQGNLLNALQVATVNGVQLTGMSLDQNYFLQPGTDSQNNNGTTIPGRPATVTERITLRLDGRDYSTTSGDQINNFVGVIVKQPYFQQVLTKTNAVQLTGPPSAPQQDSNGKTFVTFSLQCQFPEKLR